MTGGGDMEKCEWFARCENEVTHLVRHGVLGDVPTCERCVEKLGLHDLVVATVGEIPA